MYGLNTVAWAATSKSMRRLHQTNSDEDQQGTKPQRLTMFLRLGVVLAPIVLLFLKLLFISFMRAYLGSEIFCGLSMPLTSIWTAAVQGDQLPRSSVPVAFVCDMLRRFAFDNRCNCYCFLEHWIGCCASDLRGPNVRVFARLRRLLSTSRIYRPRCPDSMSIPSYSLVLFALAYSTEAELGGAVVGLGYVVFWFCLYKKAGICRACSRACPPVKGSAVTLWTLTHNRAKKWQSFI